MFISDALTLLARLIGGNALEAQRALHGEMLR